MTIKTRCQGNGTLATEHACVLSPLPTLFVTPWTSAHQAPLPMGFSRQEHWNGLPFPPPGDFHDPGIKPMSLKSPVLAGRFFTTSTTREALDYREEKLNTLNDLL